VSRLQLSAVVIAIILVFIWPARGDAFAGKPPSSNWKGDRLVVTPRNLGFGRVKVGRRKLQRITITNLGNSDVRLLQVMVRGRDFDVAGLDLPVTLAAGESYTFSGVFTPRSKGGSSATVAFVSAASGVSNPTLNMELIGMGADEDDQLAINPTTMNFGAVQVGSSASQTGTLAASANQVTISSALSSDAEFTLSGLSFPVTIPPGGSQGFMVTFTPQAIAAPSASISFLDESGTPLAVEHLSGTGVDPQDHSVSLSWNASTSQNVIGYNIYRGNQSGGPYAKINDVLDSITAYTDTSVSDGNTYYYVTTAVNSDNQESTYSNQARATIP
jgi:Cep192 domain 4/Abnormal spindle-like microcephaly-assoc'd, ASPM-SPD-2-Hydin